jgi:hypothetical protein
MASVDCTAMTSAVRFSIGVVKGFFALPTTETGAHGEWMTRDYDKEQQEIKNVPHEVPKRITSRLIIMSLTRIVGEVAGASASFARADHQSWIQAFASKQHRPLGCTINIASIIRSGAGFWSLLQPRRR